MERFKSFNVFQLQQFVHLISHNAILRITNNFTLDSVFSFTSSLDDITMDEKNKTIFILSNNRIFSYQSNTIVTLDKLNKEISNLEVTDILYHKSKESNLWLGTVKNGILRYDIIDGTLSNYLPSEGFNDIVSLNCYKDNLWICTKTNLIKLNTTYDYYKIYDQTDGLNATSFYRFNYNSTDDRLFFRNNSGLIWFHPDSINITNFLLPTIQLQSSLIENDTIKVTKDTKEIRLRIGADYEYRNAFKFKLVGLKKEDNWYSLQNTGKLTFVNLPPKEYELKFVISNCDGIWNENYKSVIVIYK